MADHPYQREAALVMKKVSFPVDIAADSFAQLLSDCTQSMYLHRFPHKYLAENAGHFFLRPLRLPGRRIGRRPITLEIDCSFMTESGKVITVFPKFCAIKFQIVTSAPKQIKVTAECNHAPVMSYFNELLREIGRLRPESREAIEAVIDEKRTGLKVIIEKMSKEGTPTTALDALDSLDHKIIEVVHQIEDEGSIATDERVAMRSPLNPHTSKPYHRLTINRRRCALRDKGYEV